MPDQKSGGIEATTQPATVTITLNNEEVEVPNIPEIIEKLQNADHSMKSGYGKLLETERAKINAERVKLQQFLDEDIKFLSTHDPEDYEYYAAKIVYGDDGGFKPPENRERKMDTRNAIAGNTVEQNADVKALQEKVKRLEETVVHQQNITAEDAKNAAERALTTSLKEFKNADKDTVIARMTSYFFTNGGLHPTPEQVRAFAKADHERISKGRTLPAVEKTPETVVATRPAFPEAGKAAPEPAVEKKRIPIWDVDRVMNDYQDFKKNQPGG